MLACISRLALPPIILIAALGTYRLALVPPQPPRLVEGRDKPWQIPPRYDWPEVVTDQQLVDVQPQTGYSTLSDSGDQMFSSAIVKR